jgi:hypothetical protein
MPVNDAVMVEDARDWMVQLKQEEESAPKLTVPIKIQDLKADGDSDGPSSL